MDNGFLGSILEKMNISNDSEKLDKLNSFYELLVEKNKVMNLTAITDYNEACIKHFADSLALIPYFDVSQCKTVADLGTGAGFPGVPLAIFFPEVQFTLIDSVNKKLLFIEESCSSLGIENVRVLHGRAEDISHGEFRQGFDLAVSRAVSNLSVLSELILGMVKKGGMFVSYKSAQSDDEIKSSSKAVELMGGRIEKVIDFTIPDTELERKFVLIKKVKDTPKRFPRKAGTPLKSPLG
ncbi:MAG: 16S rRNA (guanine(527)-N(7))-methyltransferase RsmG [Lachnospiraceae bacterium]|nr:16S rRNA (guanine(527)-N(7))-methyltransferase RsmG [Lachnospiraceae bacterium]